MSLICPDIKNASRSNPYLNFLAAQEVNYLKSILFLSQIHRDIPGSNDTDQREYAVIHLHNVRFVQGYQNVGAWKTSRLEGPPQRFLRKTILVFPIVTVQKQEGDRAVKIQCTQQFISFTLHPPPGCWIWRLPCTVVLLSNSGQKYGGTACASKVFSC